MEEVVQLVKETMAVLGFIMQAAVAAVKAVPVVRAMATVMAPAAAAALAG